MSARNKTALVTGAAHGIGRSIAEQLARDGMDIIALDACADVANVGYPLGKQAELDETVRKVRELGRSAVAISADIRDRDGLQAAYDESSEEFPTLDVIVANAGISGHGKFVDYDPATWAQIVDVNVVGTFNSVQTFLPRMIEAGQGGSIVLMSSVAGLKGIPFTSAYVASKHAIQGLMKTLALELGEHNIRVNCLNPGGVNTPLTTDPGLSRLFEGDGIEAKLFADSYNPLLDLPNEGFMEAENVTALLSWLVSKNGKYITGVSIPIEAGTLLR